MPDFVPDLWPDFVPGVVPDMSFLKKMFTKTYVSNLDKITSFSTIPMGTPCPPHLPTRVIIAIFEILQKKLKNLWGESEKIYFSQINS